VSIITLSRGTKSGGAALAELLAKKMECANVLSREVLVKASEEYGITEQELTDAMQKPPRLIERSIHNPRRLYLTVIRATLLDYARQGCLIYHGNAGHFLLKDLDWVLKVRLIAPIEQRVAALLQTTKLDRYEATQYIKKVDEDRTRWTKFLYNEDWSDPSHFDIVLNTRTMSLETCANILCSLAQAPEYRRTEERVRDVTNRALAAKVCAALELNTKTRGLDIQVTADQSTIRLSGTLEHAGLKPYILQVVKEVAGVAEVKDNLIT
jgi:cytidylate kinase